MKYTAQNAALDLPTRSRADNKTKGGKVLVIAGSRGLFGSAILCGSAAARCGAGYTYLSSSGKFPVAKHPDFLILQSHIKFAEYNAVAIGLGFRNPKKIRAYLQRMIKLNIDNVVLDAEALNVVAHATIRLPKSWIVTPHEGELSRILKIPSQKIRENRRKYILLAQKKLGCVVRHRRNVAGHFAKNSSGKKSVKIRTFQLLHQTLKVYRLQLQTGQALKSTDSS